MHSKDFFLLELLYIFSIVPLVITLDFSQDM